MKLTGKKLQQIARARAESLPGVSNGQPFTESLDVYKVADKVFLIVTDDPDELIITIKADPDHGDALRQDYPTIIPGRYLDNEHWVSVGAGSGISEDLGKDLVDDSYELVRESLPQKDRPND
ncbi:MAG: MmcQ/YjbR family DNA-binding protein [Micrococcaceae bacterium]|nr:MmcQ/YjbR family DNA-binding protein [Micrococcaceae bacterium]